MNNLLSIFEGSPDIATSLVVPLSTINPKLKLLNSRLMGSQRRIAKLIVDFMPTDVETVMHPFACGQDLTFELVRRGYKVIANDRMYYSCCIANYINSMPSDFIFEEIPAAEGYFTNNNDKFPESVRMTIDGAAQHDNTNLDAIIGRALINLSWRSQMKGWCRTDPDGRYIDRSIFIEQLYDNQTYLNKYAVAPSNLEIYNHDAYWLLNHYPFDIDMLYFGTPTVLNANNETFYKRFEIVDSVLKQQKVTFPNDWTSNNYNEKLTELLRIVKLRKIPYVCCGWGSGQETREQRYELLNKHFNHIQQAELSFKGFDDVVYMCKGWK